MGNVRNASLDGLRAVAVLLVFFYHEGVLNCGWAGVDVFFVLSGFLITGILRRDARSETYWRSFWVKRVLRIMPPLILVLLLTVALSFPITPWQAAGYLLSFGDISAYLRPEFTPLRQLWSLAVEEHFYLLWPFVIRRCGRRSLLLSLIALIAAGPMLRGIVSLYRHEWELTYFLTPFRLDGLALGAALALLMEQERLTERIRQWCVPVGLFFVACWFAMRMLLGTAFTRDNPTVAYNALSYSITAAVSACLLAYLMTHPKSLCCKLLRARPLAWLGLVSYGFYLYQLPVQGAVSRLLPRPGHYAWLVDASATLMLAVLSYYGVEKPAMRLGRRMSLPKPQDGAGCVVLPAS